MWDRVLRFTGNRSRAELLTDIGLGKRIATIVAKRLQLLHELLPGATRIAYLTNPGVPGWDRVVKVVEEAGATMALRIATVTASTPEELDRALARLAERRPDALLVGSALLFWMHRPSLLPIQSRR